MGKATTSSIYQVKITLANIRPPIWRRVEVKDGTLLKLHQVIQIAMNWDGYHLWAFEIGREQYGDDPESMMDMRSARSIKLSQIVQMGVRKFRYIYDFGDNWDHIVQIEKVIQAEPKVKYPRCVKGSRACPPEDCGGPWGYQNLLEAIRDPRHEEHEEMKEWLGDEFDPEALNLEQVNAELATVR